jgi:hypothetical protein
MDPPAIITTSPVVQAVHLKSNSGTPNDQLVRTPAPSLVCTVGNGPYCGDGVVDVPWLPPCELLPFIFGPFTRMSSSTHCKVKLQ